MFSLLGGQNKKQFTNAFAWLLQLVDLKDRRKKS